jgi:phosphatidylglycerophosphate synthase
MLSKFLKHIFGSFGRWFLNWLASSDVTPNQITYMGLALVSANCALYCLHRDTFWLGVGLSLSYTFDSLDGVIARRQGAASKFGGYLDAIADRYQEMVAYIVIAWVNDLWPVIFFVMTGSLLTSYAKARTAIEMPVDNKGWPDLLDRPRRIWILCAALILDSAIPIPKAFGGRLLYLVLVGLAVLTHFTAFQRFFRARRMLLGASDNKCSG